MVPSYLQPAEIREILLSDYETPVTEALAPNFIEFLNQLLQNPNPVFQELKGWEKKTYKMASRY